MIGKKDVLHNSQNIYYRSTVGAAEAGSSLRLGITIKSDADIKQVLLHTWEEGAGDEVLVFNPGYACYANFVRAVNAVPVNIDLCPEDGKSYFSCKIRS